MKDPVEIVSNLEQIEDGEPTYLAVGVFDGVHLGHQYLLETMIASAKKAGARAAVLTFHPHPSEVLFNRTDRLYLCTLEERVRLLANLGLDLIITHPFNNAVRSTRAADFIEQLLFHANLSQLWGGHFALGYNREGDLPFLRELGERKGFSVEAFKALIEWDGKPVSSSRVRQSLKEGDMVDVSGCLGRRYQISGKVIRGDGRGKTIGIPTANLSLWEKQLLPANGVYATYAWLDGRRYQAASNIGYRPTVNGHDLNVEAHLLGFEGNIYGQELSLEFVERIRDERKFPDISSLIAQIQSDINLVPSLLPD